MPVAQAFLGALELADASTYVVSPPRIWGALPRLARRLAVQQTALLLERSAAYGLMLSGELADTEAQGFPAEPGNFIRRRARAQLIFQLLCPSPWTLDLFTQKGCLPARTAVFLDMHAHFWCCYAAVAHQDSRLREMWWWHRRKICETTPVSVALALQSSVQFTTCLHAG